MPTEVAEAIEKKTRDHALAVEKELAEVFNLGPRLWKGGFLIVREIQDKKLWQVRSFESENKYREFLRIGRSTWYRTARLTREVALPLLEKDLLTRARLDRLTLENAELLLDLDERRRFNPTWVEKALTMSEADFEAQVQHVIANNEEPEEGLGAPESQVILKWKMATSQREMILETIKEFATRQEEPLDNEPQRLVEMLADYKAGWPEVGKVVAD
jgi:hypothetical protein